MSMDRSREVTQKMMEALAARPAETGPYQGTFFQELLKIGEHKAALTFKVRTGRAKRKGR